jgi:hypothetical protein
VGADVREGRPAIRIVLERATREIVRHLPEDIEGFLVVMEEQFPICSLLPCISQLHGRLRWYGVAGATIGIICKSIIGVS